MKKLIFAIAALCAINTYAFNVEVTRTWAPIKIKACNSTLLNNTVYTFGKPEVEAVNFYEVNLTVPVKFFRCLDKGRGAKYYQINPLGESRIEYQHYSYETGNVRSNEYVESYDSIEFVTFTDQYKLLTQQNFTGEELADS